MDLMPYTPHCFLKAHAQINSSSTAYLFQTLSLLKFGKMGVSFQRVKHTLSTQSPRSLITQCKACLELSYSLPQSCPPKQLQIPCCLWAKLTPRRSTIPRQIQYLWSSRYIQPHGRTPMFAASTNAKHLRFRPSSYYQTKLW